MPKRPLLVFINPASGTKLAKKMFTTIVKPNLEVHNLQFEVVETEYAGHAEEMARQTEDLQEQYSGIVIISGDGLIHEVYNGLAQRRDWHKICQMPVGIVPGGSGNALNCSLLSQLNQPLDGVNNLGAKAAGVNVAEGAALDQTVPLDLLEIEAGGRQIISFFGINIGLIADVDIGSEAFRCLGFLRAYPLAAMRIVFPKAYHVKVSYLPLKKDPNTGSPIPATSGDPKIDMPRLSDPVPDDWETIDDHFYLVYALNLSWLDPLTLLAPRAKVDDGILHLALVRSSMSRLESIQWFLNTQNAGHIGKTGVEIIPVRAFRIDPIGRTRGYMTIDAESVEFGPSQGQILPGKGRLMVSQNPMESDGKS